MTYKAAAGSGSYRPYKLCIHTGLERLPSGNGLTLTSCCHEGSDTNLHAICEIENQKKCCDYEYKEG